MRKVRVVFGERQSHPTGFDRVISLVRSRYCELISLEYRTGGHAASATAMLTLGGDEARLALLLHKLSMLVDVIEMEVEPPPETASAATARRELAPALMRARPGWP